MPRTNGWNLLKLLCCMAPGKPTVLFGTGIPKTTGKKLMPTIRTGRRPRTGSHPQAGLRKSSSRSNSCESAKGFVHSGRGLPCRVGGQDDNLPQFFVEDVTGHSFLSTKTENVIDLAQHPTYVILDLGCTKSMGSRSAVNKFMRVAHVHGLDYAFVPS